MIQFSLPATTANVSSDGEDKFPHRIDHTVYMNYVMISICSVGVYGTSVAILVLLTMKRKVVGDLFALAISVCDWLMNVCVLSIFLYPLAGGDWNSRLLMSYLVKNLLWCFLACFTWLTTLSLAICRFCAVCRPEEFARMYTKKRVCWSFLLNCGMAALVAVPMSTEFAGGYISLGVWAVSVAVVSVCYTNIIAKLRETRRRVRGGNATSTAYDSRGAQAVEKSPGRTEVMFTLMCVAYVVLNAPYQLLIAMSVLGWPTLPEFTVGILFFVFYPLNQLTYVINPLFFYCLRSEFRRQLLLLVRCHKPNNQSHA